jgi:hypothetical protein
MQFNLKMYASSIDACPADWLNGTEYISKHFRTVRPEKILNSAASNETDDRRGKAPKVL